MLLAEENVVLAGKGLSRWLSIIEAKGKVVEEKRENFHCQVLKSPRSLSRMTRGGFRGAENVVLAGKVVNRKNELLYNHLNTI